MIDLLAFSLTSWFRDSWTELLRYFSSFGTYQWGILSAAAVVFGFLCLRGTKIRG